MAIVFQSRTMSEPATPKPATTKPATPKPQTASLAGAAVAASPLRSNDVLLPLARVKTIMKSSPDVENIGQESLFLITKVCGVCGDGAILITGLKGKPARHLPGPSPSQRASLPLSLFPTQFPLPTRCPGQIPLRDPESGWVPPLPGFLPSPGPRSLHSPGPGSLHSSPPPPD